jgi:hypothetical protein
MGFDLRSGVVAFYLQRQLVEPGPGGQCRQRATGVYHVQEVKDDLVSPNEADRFFYRDLRIEGKVDGNKEFGKDYRHRIQFG